MFTMSWPIRMDFTAGMTLSFLQLMSSLITVGFCQNGKIEIWYFLRLGFDTWISIGCCNAVVHDLVMNRLMIFWGMFSGTVHDLVIVYIKLYTWYNLWENRADDTHKPCRQNLNIILTYCERYLEKIKHSCRIIHPNKSKSPSFYTLAWSHVCDFFWRSWDKKYLLNVDINPTNIIMYREYMFENDSVLNMMKYF